MGRRPIGSGSISRAGFLRLAGAAALASAVPPIGSSRSATDGTMETRAIPATGERLPVIGCGTWRNFDVGAAESDRAPLRGVLEALFAAASEQKTITDLDAFWSDAVEKTGNLPINPDVITFADAQKLGLKPGEADIKPTTGALRSTGQLKKK